MRCSAICDCHRCIEIPGGIVNFGNFDNGFALYQGCDSEAGLSNPGVCYFPQFHLVFVFEGLVV